MSVEEISLPCFFRGFLLYDSRKDLPALSVSMGFAVCISRGDFPAQSVHVDFSCMSVMGISLICSF
mgnify:CR=1 FL=1